MKKLIGLLLVGVMVLTLGGSALAYTVRVETRDGGRAMNGLVGAYLQKYNRSTGQYVTIAQGAKWATGSVKSTFFLKYSSSLARGVFRVRAAYIYAGTKLYKVEDHYVNGGLGLKLPSYYRTTIDFKGSPWRSMVSTTLKEIERKLK